jgi:hypothetical protein
LEEFETKVGRKKMKESVVLLEFLIIGLMLTRVVVPAEAWSYWLHGASGSLIVPTSVQQKKKSKIQGIFTEQKAD